MQFHIILFWLKQYYSLILKVLFDETFDNVTALTQLFNQTLTLDRITGKLV